mmetsp:Transcript_11027/g.22501  ORF Transcript_11027/g.22501 Transcript_11027/m.22501 type:complete len:81 (-) Transcript_11027:1461-1703(-)
MIFHPLSFIPRRHAVSLVHTKPYNIRSTSKLKVEMHKRASRGDFHKTAKGSENCAFHITMPLLFLLSCWRLSHHKRGGGK